MSVSVAMISLGCAKNLVDSEKMLAALEGAGFCLLNDAAEADVIVINTCGFIESAKQESIDAIVECAQYKKGRCRVLAAVGCLVQRYQAELRAELPEVDIFLDTLHFDELAAAVAELLPPTELPCGDKRPRLLTTPAHWSYLKIAEGCDHRCAFCAIPQMRGPYVSRPMEEIVEEARYLIGRGVKEINLLAQDTSAYGHDLYGRPMLAELLQELIKLDVVRLRLLYSYGHELGDEVPRLMAESPKICSYLDIPMQHASDDVLRRMRRPERRQQLLALVRKVRALDPDFAVRSTFIVGFPGETEEDFEQLCDFLREARLDWVGVFTYSQEEGTAAADMDGQIDEDVKADRYDTVMALLSRLSAENMERWRGKTIRVIVEGKTDPDAEYSTGYPLFGRADCQSPEVDGCVYLRGDMNLEPGTVVRARIIDTDIYDMMGEIV